MFITLILALVFGDSLKKSFTTWSQGFSFLSLALTILGFILLGVYALSLSTKKLKWVTLITLPVMIAIIAFAVFALAVSSKGGGRPVAGRLYQDYYLTSYSKWMQKKVNDSSEWQTYYRTALSNNNVCSDLTDVHKADSKEFFYQIKLSSLQSGCCKPLEECKFTYVSPTNWTKPVGQNYSNSPDCSIWSNDQSALCYSCNSCKAGFIQDVKSRWFAAGLTLFLSGTVEVLIYLFISFVCCNS